MSRVQDMHCLFRGCQRFSADVSGWDVAAVTEMIALFAFCPRFAANLSAWRVGAGTRTINMFGGAAAFDPKENAPWYSA